jgi:molecular chaperone GrpE
MNQQEPKNNHDESIMAIEENSETETIEGEFVLESEDELSTEELIEQLEQEKTRAEEYLDGWQRARAEFANYKKRVEKEQTQIYQRSANRITKQFLSVVDDLERALENRPMEGEGATWAEGIDLVYKKLLGILESEGIKPMQTEGEMFDPVFHEAISAEPNSDFESGQIIEVVQPGYMQDTNVIRPAIVRVAQ